MKIIAGYKQVARRRAISSPPSSPLSKRIAPPSISLDTVDLEVGFSRLMSGNSGPRIARWNDDYKM